LVWKYPPKGDTHRSYLDLADELAEGDHRARTGFHLRIIWLRRIFMAAIITGAFANRVNFSAYLLFLAAWLIFVHFPFAHMVWSPSGLLARIGVLDCAGGIVVRTAAGFAALASVAFTSIRVDVETEKLGLDVRLLGEAAYSDDRHFP
jgi:Amt family ammonium transporter